MKRLWAVMGGESRHPAREENVGRGLDAEKTYDGSIVRRPCEKRCEAGRNQDKT